MSQITLQGKQQALMRVAESRMAVLDAAAATRTHADKCVRALPVSPATLMRVGAAAGAAASVLGTLAGLRRRKKTAEKAAAKLPGTSSMLMQLLLQIMAPMLLPKIQQMLQEKAKSGAAASGHPFGL